MRILLYSPYSLDSHNLPMLLDEALRYLEDDRNEVLFVTCSGQLLPCDHNAEKSRIRCWECRFSSMLLLKNIKHPRFAHATLASFVRGEARKELLEPLQTIKQLGDVKKFEYRGINIGLGVVSSYITATRNLNPKFNSANRTFISELLESAMRLTDAAHQMIEHFGPDRICIFNGRFNGIRPVLEVAQQKKIQTVVIECTFSTDREQQRKVRFVDALPQDIEKNVATIENYWNDFKRNQNPELVAAQFFARRRKGLAASDNVYTLRQQAEQLPDGWDESNRNIVIFNSSEDEFFSIGDSIDKYKIFENQIEGIKYIIGRTAHRPDIRYFLRIHPALGKLKYKYHTELAGIFRRYANITVIPADSPVSTYKLIERCEKVIVFGSTVGVEATYWGKPVILLAGSFYLHLNTAYYPKSMQDLDELLLATLEPKPKIGALKYGLYLFAERGTPYKYINYNLKILKIGKKTIDIARCFEYRRSIVPYIMVVVFFRLLNIISHLHFKKITMKRLREEETRSDSTSATRYEDDFSNGRGTPHER